MILIRKFAPLSVYSEAGDKCLKVFDLSGELGHNDFYVLFVTSRGRKNFDRGAIVARL